MRKLYLPRSVAIAFCLFCLTGATDAQEKTNYQITLEGKIKMSGPALPAEQKIVSLTKTEYTNTRNQNEVELQFKQQSVEVEQDGKVIVKVAMSAESFEDLTTEKILIEDAGEGLKTMLEDSYGSTICKFNLDENGKEKDREVVAKPGAAALVANGQIENARLFHAAFFPNKETWKSPVRISLGNGNFVGGDLTYKKTSKSKGFQTVKVSGALKIEGDGSVASLKLVNVDYQIDGSQRFDIKKKQWADGALTATVKFDMSQGGRVGVSSDGTIKITLERRIDSKD